MRMIVRCFAANDWSASAQFSPPPVTMTATFSELSEPFTCLFEKKFSVTQIRQPELLLNKLMYFGNTVCKRSERLEDQFVTSKGKKFSEMGVN